MAAEAELALRTIGPPDPAISVPEQDEWMARLGSLPLLAHPGERWLYNTGASVAGVLVARAAGQELGHVLRTRLFEPLGMRDTAFFTPDTDRLASLYRPTPGAVELWDPPDGAWSRPPSFEDGAAGLVSSIDDELTFGQLLLHRGAIGGRRILSERTAVAMCSDQLTGAQRARGGLGPGFFDDLSWGYGQAIQNDGSFGWAGGFGSTWLVDPARDLVVVVLSQVLFASSAGHPVHDAIQAAARTAAA
jgi:CubicO group peptidase (beta-lactamase class C family)